VSEILRRIERALGVPDLADRLAGDIQQADLHSLLIEVFRRRAAARTPADLLADHASNRFARPSAADPRALLRFDLAAYEALPPGFESLELSPVCPLGTSSVLATVNQDKALPSIRSVEVLSDATNVLALECATRRRGLLRKDAKSAQVVALAASHRHLRTPPPPELPGFRAHFKLFALCSAGRDLAGQRFHGSALATHLDFYARLLLEFLGPGVPIRVALTDLGAEEPRAELERTLLAPLRQAHPRVTFEFDQSRASGHGYYIDFCFKLYANDLELGDGGAVDWTRKLLSNAKERLVISGISSERSCSLLAPS
jgi:hypothetical protein